MKLSKKAENTKEKIYQSALKLFVKNGFQTSTASISKSAGVSTGILFHYFPTKNDLIVELYTILLMEYYQTVLLLNGPPKNDYEAYRTNSKAAWEACIKWALKNWNKFLYIRLYENSVLAEQLNINDSPEIAHMKEQFDENVKLAIQYNYFKDLPADYLNNISQTSLSFTIDYLHSHPEYQNNKELLDKFWEVHWEIYSKPNPCQNNK